jgi:hypothetical protein
VTGVTNSEEVYERLAAEQLRKPGVSIGRTMHNEVLTVHGKIFAFRKGDRLVVKLPAAEVADLIRDGRGLPFQSGGRVMREWVAVELPDDGAAWARLMATARQYVDPSQP